MESDEELETGYGIGAPAGDNLCNDYAQGLAEAFMGLAAARGDRVVSVDADVAMSDSGSPSLFGNVVVVRRPIPDAEWPELATRVHEFYAGAPGGPFIVFSAWPTPDLTGRGFGRIGHPPLQPFAGRRFISGDGWSARGWRMWVGYLDGEPVATAAAYVGPHHVDVEMISARPEVRGRGVGRAVTATATLAAPDRPAMLISSDDGYPVYARLGYVPILRFTLWAGHRTGAPSP